MFKQIGHPPPNTLDVLSRHGLLTRSDDAMVTSAASQTSRRQSRPGVFQVWRNGSPRIQLYTGRNLSALHHASTEFHRACPEITCAPLFFLRDGDTDFLGFEFVVGPDLESGYRSGTLGEAELLELVLLLDQGLLRSEERSSCAAASREFDEMIESVCSSDVLNRYDSAFLRIELAPRLKEALITPEPALRWTNGDFIARNMLAGKQGPKLIDYEFACATHFFLEDWARILRLSTIPGSVADLAGARLGGSRNAVKLYSLLRQIVLESRINPPTLLGPKIVNLAQSFPPLVSELRRGEPPSVFFQDGGDGISQEAAESTLQVFFSRNGDFDANQVVSETILEGVWRKVESLLPIGSGEWSLRIDPIQRTGVILISSIEYDGSGADTESLSGRRTVPLDEVKAVGTAVLLSAHPLLQIISHGSDPQLKLPAIVVGEGGPVRLNLFLRWERLDVGLGAALAALRSDNDARLEQVRCSIESELQQRREGVSEALLQARTALANEIAARTELETRLAVEEEKAVQFQERIEATSGALLEARISLAKNLEARTKLEDFYRGFDEANRAAISAERNRRIDLESRLSRSETGNTEKQRQIDALVIEGIALRRTLQSLQDMPKPEPAQVVPAPAAKLGEPGLDLYPVLRQQIVDQKARVLALEQSLSWRITAPLRSLANLVQWTPSNKT